MLPSANGIHSWIPAGAVKDPKAVVTKDENLSWEEFNELSMSDSVSPSDTEFHQQNLKFLEVSLASLNTI